MRVTRWGLLGALAVVSAVLASVPVVVATTAEVEVPGDAAVVGVRPVRLLDTRTAPAGAPIQAGTEVAVEVDRGAGDVGVYLNVTAMLADAPGHLTVYPCGQARPVASSFNYVAGGVVANAVLVGIGTAGQVCLFAHSTVHVVVDVTGYLPSASDVRALTPARLLDTRGGAHPTVDGSGPTGRVPGGSVIEVQVGGRALAPVNSGAAAVTVTTVLPDSPGYVTVFPCDAPTRPVASSLNYAGGDVVASTVLTRLDAAGRVCVFTRSAADLVVDLVAVAPRDSESIDITTPARLLDTRTAPGAVTADGLAQGVGRVPARHVLELRVAGRVGSDRLAAVTALTVTAVGPAAAGHLTVFPCEADLPPTSSLNYSAGRTVANTVLVGVSRRSTVCIYTHAETDLVVDVAGFTATPFEHAHPITFAIPGAPLPPGAPDVAVRSLDQQLSIDGDLAPPFKWWESVTGHAAIGGTGVDEGRYVTYVSRNPEISGQATPGAQQVYWYDRLTQETVLVSKHASGEPAAGDSMTPQISDDGMTVVFRGGGGAPAAAGQVATGISVWNRVTNQVVSLDVPLSSSEAFADARLPAISGDGRWVGFVTGGAGATPARVYLTELGTDAYELISVDASGDPVDGGPLAISGDGRAVAFYATGDVGGIDPDPATWDVFVWRDGEYSAVTTARGPGPEQSTAVVQPDISADGRWVAWWTTTAGSLASPTWSAVVTDATNGSSVTVPTGRGLDALGNDGNVAIGVSYGPLVFAPVLAADGSRLAVLDHLHDLAGTGTPIVHVPWADRLALSPGGTQVAFSVANTLDVGSPDTRPTPQPGLNYYGVFAGPA